MKNLAVFASGTGSNFEAIADACADGRLDARVALMVCDVPSAAVHETWRGRKLVDYVAAGNAFCESNTLTVWFKK